MKMTKKKARYFGVGTLAVTALIAASPAFALSAQKAGAKGWTEQARKVMNIQDNQDDGRWVKAEYVRTSDPHNKKTLWNKQDVDGNDPEDKDNWKSDNDGSPRTVESGSGAYIGRMQVCEYANNWPDDCSGWVSD